jgi:hypothetical protein
VLRVCAATPLRLLPIEHIKRFYRTRYQQAGEPPYAYIHYLRLELYDYKSKKDRSGLGELLIDYPEPLDTTIHFVPKFHVNVSLKIILLSFVLLQRKQGPVGFNKGHPNNALLRAVREKF